MELNSCRKSRDSRLSFRDDLPKRPSSSGFILSVCVPLHFLSQTLVRREGKNKSHTAYPFSVPVGKRLIYCDHRSLNEKKIGKGLHSYLALSIPWWMILWPSSNYSLPRNE
ncbi:hypothetical protein NPIL_149351 [Nephila pilipes]|uniref:Uncharacterized protein n=1 Tax=Nephila pilipes TaxID=299642 RepID=A0A8X6TWZ7_NEPPI|nr:hypothetical protein NPIL_149351 [Nephila pilipes]